MRDAAALLSPAPPSLEKTRDHFPVTGFCPDRCIGRSILVRGATRRLADGGPVKRRAFTGGVSQSRRSHSDLWRAHRTMARHLSYSYLDRLQRAGCADLQPL